MEYARKVDEASEQKVQEDKNRVSLCHSRSVGVSHAGKRVYIDIMVLGMGPGTGIHTVYLQE